MSQEEDTLSSWHFSFECHLPVGRPEKESQVASVHKTTTFDLESRGTNTHLWVTGSRGALMVLPADVQLGEEPQELHVAHGLRSEEAVGIGGRELISFYVHSIF